MEFVINRNRAILVLMTAVMAELSSAIPKRECVITLLQDEWLHV